MTFSDIGNAIAKTAPLLASALFGPAAGTVVGLLTSVFGGDSNNPKDLLSRIITDPQSAIKLAEIEANNKVMLQQLEIEKLKIESSERIAQTEVNKAEAQSGDKYAAGWRPTVGYICCAGLAWSFVLQPFLTFMVIACGVNRTFPTVATSDLMTLLVGMLGFGYMRSYDKKNKG